MDSISELLELESAALDIAIAIYKHTVLSTSRFTSLRLPHPPSSAPPPPPPLSLSASLPSSQHKTS